MHPTEDRIRWPEGLTQCWDSWLIVLGSSLPSLAFIVTFLSSLWIFLELCSGWRWVVVSSIPTGQSFSSCSHACESLWRTGHRRQGGAHGRKSGFQRWRLWSGRVPPFLAFLRTQGSHSCPYSAPGTKPSAAASRRAHLYGRMSE